jgi:hypothetical protein
MTKTKSAETEIGILQEQMKVAQSDITEIKMDIKTIIATLDGNFVSRGRFEDFEKNFESYKKSQLWQKLVIAFGFSLMGALIGFFFNHIK